MIIYHDESYYERRKPHPNLGPFRNFLRFIWNNDRRTLLDRTVGEWGEVSMFYAVFFSGLFAVFFLQLFLTVWYISSLDRPYFQYVEVQERHLFGMQVPGYGTGWSLGSPGLGYKPSNVAPFASPIIWLSNSSTNIRSRRYIRSLTDFLNEYNRNTSDYDTKCNDQIKFDYKAKPCFFDRRTLGACSRAPYGYRNPLQPCVFLKFNKQFDWIPNYYNQSSELPSEMPIFLKEVVKESKEFRIWLSCGGANNVDKDHIGEIEYIPSPGFPVGFFPFSGQPDYLSPIVAIRFKNLTLNRLITVRCTLWAFNIDYHSHEFLYFQILIDA